MMISFLTQLHELIIKLCPLECTQGFTKIWPSDLVFDPTWPSLKLDLDILWWLTFWQSFMNFGSKLFHLECTQAKSWLTDVSYVTDIHTYDGQRTLCYPKSSPWASSGGLKTHLNGLKCQGQHKFCQGWRKFSYEYCDLILLQLFLIWYQSTFRSHLYSIQNFSQIYPGITLAQNFRATSCLPPGNLERHFYKQSDNRLHVAAILIRLIRQVFVNYAVYIWIYCCTLA